MDEQSACAPGGEPPGAPDRQEHMPAAPDALAVTEGLRAHVALWRDLRREAEENGAAHTPGEGDDADAQVGWNYLAVCMARAERVAQIGARLEMRSLRGAVRVAARLAARVIAFFAQFLIKPQREYNAAVLEALRTYQACVQSRLRSLRRLVAAQNARLLALERQVGAAKSPGEAPSAPPPPPQREGPAAAA
jgi:hypothetical protein